MPSTRITAALRARLVLPINQAAMFTAEAMTVHTQIMINLTLAAMATVEATLMVASANLAQDKATAPLSAMASVAIAKAPAIALVPTATAAVTTVASDRAIEFQEESLMMADAATSVVLAVLLSAAASEDAVLMDVDMTPSMTTVKLVVSTPTVNSPLNNAMLVISKTSVVREVSQDFTVTRLTLLRDQDLADSRAVEASIMASVDSVMSVPTRTLAVYVVSARSKLNVVLTTDMVSEASTVLAAVMILFALVLLDSVVLVKVSANKALFLTLEVTTFSIEEAKKSDLVLPVADQTNAFNASVLVKEFQVDFVKVRSTEATAEAMVATADTDGEDTEYLKN